MIYNLISSKIFETLAFSMGFGMGHFTSLKEIHVHECMYVCMYMHMYVCMYVCMYVYFFFYYNLNIIYMHII